MNPERRKAVSIEACRQWALATWCAHYYPTVSIFCTQVHSSFCNDMIECWKYRWTASRMSCKGLIKFWIKKVPLLHCEGEQNDGEGNGTDGKTSESGQAWPFQSHWTRGLRNMDRDGGSLLPDQWWHPTTLRVKGQTSRNLKKVNK